ncbi:MAG: hypothetical protein ACN4GZ_14875, partial [Acidimicrobiales bacterium]
MATTEEIRSALDPFWTASGFTPTPSLAASAAGDDRSAFRTALAASASCGAVVAAVAELTGRPA